MMGHRGMIPLDQNYFKTPVPELAQEHVGIVPDLSTEDSVRLKHSNTQMSAGIRVPEDRDAKITRLEKKAGGMEDMRVGMLDMDRRLKESDGMGLVGEHIANRPTHAGDKIGESARRVHRNARQTVRNPSQGTPEGGFGKYGIMQVGS